MPFINRPVFLEGINEILDIRGVERLGQEGRRACGVGLIDCFDDIEIAHSDPEHPRKIISLFFPAQNIKAVGRRHFEVEKNDFWERESRAVLEFSFAGEVLNGFSTAADNVNWILYSRGRECAKEKKYVRLGIIGNQNRWPGGDRNAPFQPIRIALA